MSPKGLLRDPLLHFLLAGLLLFVAYRSLQDEQPVSQDASTIVVDTDNLLRFIQYRTKSFDDALASQRLDALTGQPLDDVIAEFVEEEAMYRSALKFGLNVDDYVIRRRLVQKMDFMAEGIGRESSQPTEQQLRTYLLEHTERYTTPANVTFTHVFFSLKTHADDEAKRLANDALIQLNAEGVPFSGSPNYGERFTYQLNYVERPLEEVTAHFGKAMAEQIFALSPDQSRWVGPFASPHGYHAVLLREYEESHLPTLDQVTSQVRQDYLADQARRRRTNFAEGVVSQYRIEIADSIRARQSP